jgi:predicted NUDIX family NTP pyrophosphohydrolase
VAKRSAGLLLYKLIAGELHVFLVHPGGPFWARKDDGAWSIPKGEIDDGEDPLVAALREFREETGHSPAGTPVPLEPVRQAGGKTVLAWAMAADADADNVQSQTFSLEWPPRSGQMREFPEIDRAAWFDIETARQKVLKGQLGLLAQLCALCDPPG